MIVLNDEQQEAFDLAVNGISLFIDGSGGCGKSTVLKKVADHFQAERKSCVLCAPTGIAAVNIGGMTIHRSFNLKPWQTTFAHYKEKKNSRTFTSSICILKELDVLIIDEISMVSADLFTLMDQIARYERGRYNEAFGGLQVLIFGDFYQLPPIIKDKSGRTYAFETNTWKELGLQTIQLTKVMRQQDGTFAQQLNHLRKGVVDDDLLPLFHAAQSLDLATDHLRLECVNADKDAINSKAFAELEGEPYIYRARYTGGPNAKELLQGCNAPDSLALKPGCPVLHLANSNGLCNGSFGVVIDPAPDFFNNRTGPLVQVDGKEIEIKSYEWSINDHKGRKMASKSQIPLMLAWSVSIHRSQGQTLDKVQVNLSKVFAKGQAYVALSRVKSKDGLKIIGTQKKTKTQIKNMFSVDPLVDEFYANLS